MTDKKALEYLRTCDWDSFGTTVFVDTRGSSVEDIQMILDALKAMSKGKLYPRSEFHTHARVYKEEPICLGWVGEPLCCLSRGGMGVTYDRLVYHVIKPKVFLEELGYNDS
jgi:hypothetical protein